MIFDELWTTNPILLFIDYNFFGLFVKERQFSSMKFPKTELSILCVQIVCGIQLIPQFFYESIECEIMIQVSARTS